MDGVLHVVHLAPGGSSRGNLTGAGEQLLDFLVFRHILDGSVDLLSDHLHSALPFQVAVTPIQEPVCLHNNNNNRIINRCGQQLISFIEKRVIKNKLKEIKLLFTCLV